MMKITIRNATATLSALCLCSALVAQQLPNAPRTAQPRTTLPGSATAPAGPVPSPINTAVRTVPVGKRAVRVPVRAITKLHGAIENEISGIGLVTGLNGTGATDDASRLAIANFVQKFGINVTPQQIATGSAALVSVSAKLPSFARIGRRVDCQVQAISNSDSIEGGYLQMTTLLYYDGSINQVFATASGTVSTGGLGFGSTTTRVLVNNPRAGRINQGAQIVEELEPEILSESGDLELILTRPDLQTAHRIATAVRQKLSARGLGARVMDEGLIRILLPQEAKNRDGALSAMRLVGELQVEAVAPLVVVIDLNSGTIIAGADVQISPCVVVTSDISVAIRAEDEVSQPNPFSDGQTTFVQRSDTLVETRGTEPAALQNRGVSVTELVENLRAVQLPSRKLIDVFQELHRGGFLQAPLEIR